MNKIKMIAIVLLFVTAGCSSSRITSSWTATNNVPKKYNKIMVLGLISDQDKSIRSYMETHIVGDLEGLGYKAVSSLALFGPTAFDNLCEKDAIDKIKNSGADAVITIVLMDKSKEQYYVSPHWSNAPRSVYYERFGGYYSTIYGRVFEPSYFAADTKYFWESNLYEMSTKTLVYSVQTESFEPASVEKLAHEYGKLIVEDMVSKAALVKQP